MAVKLEKESVMAVPSGPGTYTDIVDVAAKPSFIARVNYAVVIAAVNVAAEDPATPNHAARVAFANTILIGGTAPGAVNAVLANSTIAAESDSSQRGENIPDGDLQFAVNSVFNALAGINK